MGGLYLCLCSKETAGQRQKTGEAQGKYDKKEHGDNYCKEAEQHIQR